MKKSGRNLLLQEEVSMALSRKSPSTTKDAKMEKGGKRSTRSSTIKESPARSFSFNETPLKKEEQLEIKDTKMNTAPKSTGRGRGRKKMIRTDDKEQHNDIKRSLFKAEIDPDNEKQS